MLVLSRKPEQEFCFPQLGVTVRVLSVQGSRVRVGIDAPDDIEIVRSELPHAQSPRQPAPMDRHELRNRLNTARLGLHLAQRQFELNNATAGDAALRGALQELTRLEQTIAGSQPPAEAARQCRVLVVEDDANESRLLAGILELEGYVVETAADGDEAVQHLLAQVPDFVLLDMRMPRRNGSDTIRWIRNQDALRALRVFSVSASSPEEYGVPIGDGGVDAWFPKPLDPAKMLERLRSLHHSAV